MKESEAKTKRCCGPFPCGQHDSDSGLTGIFAYSADSDRVPVADMPCGFALAQRYCIGSKCMAWVEWPDQLDDSGDMVAVGNCGLALK